MVSGGIEKREEFKGVEIADCEGLLLELTKIATMHLPPHSERCRFAIPNKLATESFRQIMIADDICRIRDYHTCHFSFFLVPSRHCSRAHQFSVRHVPLFIPSMAYQKSTFAPAVLLLLTGGQEAHDAIDELTRLAGQVGFEPHELDLVLNLIFESQLPISTKTTLISNAIIPTKDSHLPEVLMLRVLAAIGTPEIYYVRGNQEKLKRLPFAVQTKLIQWLIAALPVFGNEAINNLRALLPILYGLLPYEFTRASIVTLIVLADLECESTRPWHINLVAKLAVKFPFDPALKALLAHYQHTLPGVNLRRFFKDKEFPSLKEGTGVVQLGVLEGFPSYGRHVGSAKVRAHMNKAFSRFKTMFVKRRRIEPTAQYNMGALHKGRISLSAINSVQKLVNSFEKIEIFNPTAVVSVLTPSSLGLADMYVVFRLLLSAPNEQVFKKLDYGIRYHILAPMQHKSLLAFSQLVKFGQSGGLFKFDEALILYMSLRDARATEAASLLTFLDSQHDSSQIIANILNLVNVDKDDTSTVILSLALYLKKELLDGNLAVGALVVPRIFDFITENWNRFTLTGKLSSSLILHALRSVKGGHAWLVPSPTFVYQLLVCTNPLVVSELLGYLAHLKSVNFTNHESLELRNIYITDCINYIWRDMAFKFDPSSFSRGMFLDEEFARKLVALNYFSHSDIIQLSHVGGLVQNPAFSYLCAELIWALEDGTKNITTRHPGPISESSVARLLLDLDSVWLSLSYYELKVSVLRSLEAVGLNGLGELLFTSVRQLMESKQN